MSALGALLDSFDGREGGATPAGQTPVADLHSEDIEADRLAAYESGYRSGWDDCLAAEMESIRKVEVELARNLADLGFTYHEARSQLLEEVEGLLEALFAQVLPSIVGPAVVRRLIDDVLDLASEALDQPVEIVVSSMDVAQLHAMLPEAPTIPVSVIEEPALAKGQAYLRFGRSERSYDLGQVVERLLAVLTARSAKSTERQSNAG
jgi:flagellar biosynthesis/type III secretory pathway protein FliH